MNIYFWWVCCHDVLDEWPNYERIESDWERVSVEGEQGLIQDFRNSGTAARLQRRKGTFRRGNNWDEHKVAGCNVVTIFFLWKILFLALFLKRMVRHRGFTMEKITLAFGGNPNFGVWRLRELDLSGSIEPLTSHRIYEVHYLSVLGTWTKQHSEVYRDRF